MVGEADEGMNMAVWRWEKYVKNAGRKAKGNEGAEMRKGHGKGSVWVIKTDARVRKELN